MTTITTHNLHECTAQEVFDFVCAAVIKQGCAAILGRSCVYLTVDGKKCAAGQLMRKEDVYMIPSNRLVKNLTREDLNILGWKLDLANTSIAHICLVGALQHAHDQANTDDFVESFKLRAESVALELGLNVDILAR